MSIRRRLTILLLLTFGLLLGAGGAVIFFWTHLALEKEFDAALRARLQAMAAFVWPTSAGLDLAFLESFEAGSRLQPMPEYFEVLARDGTCLAR